MQSQSQALLSECGDANGDDLRFWEGLGSAGAAVSGDVMFSLMEFKFSVMEGKTSKFRKKLGTAGVVDASCDSPVSGAHISSSLVQSGSNSDTAFQQSR